MRRKLTLGLMFFILISFVKISEASRRSDEDSKGHVTFGITGMDLRSSGPFADVERNTHNDSNFSSGFGTSFGYSFPNTDSGVSLSYSHNRESKDQ